MLKMLKSLGFALNGIISAFKSEQNLRFHFCFSLVVLMMSYASGITRVEWLFVILAIGFVISAELLNTALENAVDLASKGKTDSFARIAKDASAGGVLISAITAVIIGAVIFINEPRITDALAFLKSNLLYACVLLLVIIIGIVTVFFKKDKEKE